MEKERPKERSNFFSTKFIRFLGGKNLFFTLIILLLLACVIFMFQKVSFIFTPLKVLFEVVILPGGTCHYWVLFITPNRRAIRKMAHPKSLGYLSSIHHFDWYYYVISSTCLSVFTRSVY